MYVEGKLTTRTWDDKDTGKKIYRTEVVVLDVGLLSNKNGGNNGSSDRRGQVDRALRIKQPFTGPSV